MGAFTTVTRDRGVTVIPAALREAAHVREGSELTWVQIEPELWIVGTRDRHPEVDASVVATALHAKNSPFPTILHRAISLTPIQRGRPAKHDPGVVTALTEEQMVQRGGPAEVRQHARGR
jgi:bifunctional DNA-binding transcriptional regulator/antitoxin component of YhaV-PrlF toxin-antitoxin module